MFLQNNNLFSIHKSRKGKRSFDFVCKGLSNDFHILIILTEFLYLRI